VETYEDKVLRVARAIWTGFGGDAYGFPREGALMQKYLDAAKSALEEEARDIEEVTCGNV
jgi:hypothetical protein